MKIYENQGSINNLIISLIVDMKYVVYEIFIRENMN